MNPETESASARERASRVRYQVLAAACTMAIIVYIHRVGFARALPKVSNDLGLGDHHAGWLTAIFMVAYGIFEIPWGAMGDRFGARHLLTVLVVGSGLLTGCVALVTVLPTGTALPFAVLLLLRFLFGAIQAGAFPILSRIMADWMPLRERGSAQGFIWMSTRLGGMVIPLLLGWLMVRTGNWQTPLWIVASFGFIWAAAFWPWFRNRPEEKTTVTAAERDLISAGRVSSAGHSHHNIPWGLILRSRNVWALCLMVRLHGLCRELLRDAAAHLPGKASSIAGPTNGLAFQPSVCVRRSRLLGRRRSFRLDHPQDRKSEVGPPVERHAWYELGRGGMALSADGQGFLDARLPIMFHLFL